MEILELARSDGFRVGHVGPVLVTVFRNTATLDRLQKLEVLEDALLRQHPKLFTFTIIVGDRVQAPPAEVRDFAGRLQKKFDPSTTGSVTVLAVSGLGAMVARTFLAALALITPGTTPSHTVRTIRDGAEWAKALPGQPMEVALLADGAAELERFARI